MTPSWEIILGAVMGTGGSGILAVAWGIVKDTRARKLVNEESAMGQLRYLKEEAERAAREAREDADRRIAAAETRADKRVAAANGRADRAEQTLALYRDSYAAIWRAYTIGPPPGKQKFPFVPGVDSD